MGSCFISNSVAFQRMAADEECFPANARRRVKPSVRGISITLALKFVVKPSAFVVPQRSKRDGFERFTEGFIARQ